MRIETREAGELKRPRWGVRRKTELADLRRSLKRYGLLQPIVVNAKGEVVAGQRRSEALPANAKIPVIVREELDDEVKSLAARLTEELSREQWNPVELAEAVRRYYELRRAQSGRKLSRDELAEELAITESLTDKYLDIAGLPSPIKEKVAEERLSPFDALTIGSIKGLEDREKEKIAEKVAEGRLPGGRRLVTEVAPFIRDTVKDERLRPVREQIIKNPRTTFEKAQDHAERLMEKVAREEAGANFINTVEHLGFKIRARIRYWRLSLHSARKVVPYFKDKTWEGVVRELKDLQEEVDGFLALRRVDKPAQAELPVSKSQMEKAVDLVMQLDGTFAPAPGEE